MEQTPPHPPSPSVPMVPIQPFDMPTTPEARRSEDGGSSRRDSPSAVELTRSRENSVHNGEGALSNMTREMQLALYPMFMCEDRHESADLGREPPGTSEELVSKWRMKDQMGDDERRAHPLPQHRRRPSRRPEDLPLRANAVLDKSPIDAAPESARRHRQGAAGAVRALAASGQVQAPARWAVEDVTNSAFVPAKRQNERVLLHYNGQSVPRPTVNGEVWVFNKSYTQYIPLSIYDLQAWTGNPAIYVFD